MLDEETSIAGNVAERPSTLLDRGVASLKAHLPPDWTVERQSVVEPGERPEDAALVVGPNNQQLRMLVEVRERFTPRDVESVLGGRLAAIKRFTGTLPVLVMAPWLSERTRERLAQAGLNYLDLAGNVRISSTYPAVFIDLQSTSPPPRSRQSEPALRGIKAGRVVRLLADVAPPYGVLELAAAADLTPGYMSRLLDMLDREAVVERSRRGGIAAVDWPALLRKRARSYSVLETNTVSRFVCPNGPGFALEAARDLGLAHVALTGSFAAEQIVQLASPALLLLYSSGSLQELVDLARLLPTDQGANVIALQPYDHVVTDRTSVWLTAPLPPRVPVVAATQLVLDCLTGPGRMPAEGEALISWMQNNESRWRLPSLARVLEGGV